MPDATETTAPPKAFHLELDTVPDVVRDHVARLVRQIELAMRSAEVIEWIDGVMEGLGIHHSGTIPSSIGDGAWCTIMLKDAQQLGALRRVLVANHWHLTEKQDYPGENRMVLSHTRGDQGLALNCYIGGAGSRCQYVKVGEKSVPVMELRCDGEAVAP